VIDGAPALGVQLALNGLADVGVIHLTIGH
jgi:hypothetical protein